MHLTTLADHEKLYIGYDAAEQWLYVDWRGRHDQESARAACRLMLDVQQQYPCPKILNDNSSVTSTSVQLSDTAQPWVAAMHQAGLRYLAWVYPPDFAARRAFEQMLQNLAEPAIASFDDLASACEWLRRQELAPRRADRVG